MLLAVNAVMAVVLFVLEREWGFHYESSQSIRYDRIDLIRPEQRGLLLEDLRLRTGLPIKRVEIGRLNFLNDTAELRVYYDEPRSQRAAGRHDLGRRAGPGRRNG